MPNVTTSIRCLLTSVAADRIWIAQLKKLCDSLLSHSSWPWLSILVAAFLHVNNFDATMITRHKEFWRSIVKRQTNLMIQNSRPVRVLLDAQSLPVVSIGSKDPGRPRKSVDT